MTVTLPAWFAALRDPTVGSALILVATALAGPFMLWAGWRGVARTVLVPLQTPWLVSCGMGALALTGASLAALMVHLGRRQTAVEQAAADELSREAFDLIDDLSERVRTKTS